MITSIPPRPSCVAQSLPALMAAGLILSGHQTASAADPVTQAWADHVRGPEDSFLEAAGVAAGPAGGVFLAGHARSPGMSDAIVVSRHDATGQMLWQTRREPDEDGAAVEVAVDLVVDGSFVYVVGNSHLPGRESDFLVWKLRNTGEEEWSARFDGEGHYTDRAVGIAVDGEGRVIVAGDSVGPDGTLDVAVIQYSPEGELVWVYNYHGQDYSWDRLAGLRLDAAGNIHLAGTSYAGSFYSSTFVIKVNPEGQELWVAREDTTYFFGIDTRAMDLDEAGRVVIAGNERNYCVTRAYDADGHPLWKARYRAEEPGAMHAAAVRFDPAGRVVLGANLFGPGTNDALVVQYDVEGQQLWAARVGDPRGSSHLQALDVDGDGNAYLTTAPASDVVTVKIGSGGSQLWSVTYNSRDFFSDTGQFLDVTPSGDLHVAGRSIYFTNSFVSLVTYTQHPVRGLPLASVDPALQVADPGDDVVFTAQVPESGTGPVLFQWRRNGRALPGATASILTLTDVDAFDRGDYSVAVSNAMGGTISAEARLTVRIPPQVTVDPGRALAYLGTDTAFIASVTGNEFATLQWRHNDADIPGATNEVLYLPHLTSFDQGAYDIAVSTLGGAVTSSASGLTVSGDVALVGSTSLRGVRFSWDYGPLLRVQPNGESFIASMSNHLAHGSVILLSKQAADGSPLWSAEFGSAEFTNAEPTALALDAEGNTYLTGRSLQPSIPAASAVMKFNPDGHLLWFRIHAETNDWGAVTTLAVDPQGHSVVGTRGGPGSRVRRYNSDGDILWTLLEPFDSIDVLAVAVDASGNTFVGETFRFGNNTDTRLRRIRLDGSTAWTLPHEDGAANWLGGLAVDSTGHLIVVGTGDLPGVPDSWMFIRKYTPDGIQLWETRTGSGSSEIRAIHGVAVGPGDDITVLTASDDDHCPEQSGVTRVRADGRLVYRIAEPQIIVSNPSQLALDNFGNAYISGSGGRPATGADVVLARFDARGLRTWIAHHGQPSYNAEYGLAVGVDAQGDVRVLASTGSGSPLITDYTLFLFRQRDPAGTFRIQLVRDGPETFQLRGPAGVAFGIEVSTNMTEWGLVPDGEAEALQQPGGGRFSDAPRRHFRLVKEE